jgi:cytochrome oxidase assembly protein ShyY1
MQTDNVGADRRRSRLPAGEVTVVGWVRADATGDAPGWWTVHARDLERRRSAGPRLPVYGGFVDAQRETPPPAQAARPAELPDLGNGPHFFYGLQWWFFGLLAVFGFFYLAYDAERRAQDR